LSPDFMKLYSPRQLELLDEISELNERDAQLRREIIKEKNKTTRADEPSEE